MEPEILLLLSVQSAILLLLSVQSAILPIVSQVKPVHALPARFCCLRQVHEMNV